MADIMIDIETLDTEATAVITQIGTVLFDRISGEILETSNRYSNVCDQIDLGRTMSTDTLAFWVGQGKSLEWWETRTADSPSLDYALYKLSDFIKTHSYEYIWANSPSFDLVILINALRQAQRDIPWNFRKERDVRTLMSLVPASCKVNRGTHDALEDSIDQAQSVVNAFIFLNRRTP